MDDPQLQEGIQIAQLGLYDQARNLFLQVIRRNPQSELAWLWLAQVLDEPKRQMDCLQRVLHINPDNQDAQQGMEALQAGRLLPEPGIRVEDAIESAFAVDADFPEEALLDAGMWYGEEESVAAPPVAAATPVEASESAPFVEELPETPAFDFSAEPESFLERARRARSQPAFVSSASVAETDADELASVESAARDPFAPTDIFLPTEPEEGDSPAKDERPAMDARPAKARRTSRAAADTSSGASKRPFRLLDRRVLFGILGIVDLPLVLLLLFFLWRGGSLPFFPGARAQQPRPASGFCRNLDLDAFTLTETLGGELGADTIYSGTEVLVTETLVVPEGRRLLVMPGATLVFTPGATLEVYGDLYACGAKEFPVVFTAVDEVPGGWEGIRLYNPSSASVLDYTVLQYAGERALYVGDSTPLLSNLTIAHSALFPISLEANGVPDLSKGLDLAANPFNGVEIRPGAVQIPSAVWPDYQFVYVISGLLRIDEGAALDISPGVIVKFWQPPMGQLPGIWVRGLLKAETVYFTSVYDSGDDVGGVTYPEAVDPQPGDWGSITFFQSSAKSYLRGVVVRYGGRSNSAVSIRESAPELSQLTVSDTAWYPLSADAVSAPIISDLSLSNNTPGNAVEISGGFAATGETEYTWGPMGQETPIARVVRDVLTVGPELTLTILPGTVVKFTHEGQLVVQGVLTAIGGSDPGERIIFTSIYDDDYGGSAGERTTPQTQRAWGGIILDGVDATTDVQNAVVRYASMSLLDASPNLFSNEIGRADGAGLRMTPGSMPDMRANRFEENGLNGIAILTGTIAADQYWPRIGGLEDQTVRVLEGEVTVGPDAILDIEAGTTIKAAVDGKLTVLGSLRAKGRADQMIVFTSLHDDLIGGDTNKRLLDAAAGDWFGLDIGPEANVHLAHVGIYYAQYGLTLQGEALPIVDEGRVHIAYGQQSLRCEGRFQIPPTYLIENNEADVTRCPAQ